MSQPTDGAGPRRYADELRHEIDAGRTGDKVAYTDPAAAPLGADEEAAGAGPSSAAVQRAMTDEARGSGRTQPTGDGSWTLLDGGPAYALAGLIVVAVLVTLFYAITNLR